MPVEGANAATKSMCIFKFSLAIFYLIVVNYGAIVYPKLLYKQSKHWFESGRYLIVYQTIYNLAWYNICLNLCFVGGAMLALFVACRCTFFGSSDTIISPIEGKWRYWKYLLVPFFVNFISCWLVTTTIVGMQTWHVVNHMGAEGILQIVRDLLFLLLIKSLIGVNVTLLTFRGFFLLSDFQQDVGRGLFNEYDFGEHLNIIFRV